MEPSPPRRRTVKQVSTVSHTFYRFNSLQRETQRMIDSLAAYSGLNKLLIEKIVRYARELPSCNEVVIDSLIFTAQISQRFNINTPFMIKAMFEAFKQPQNNYLTIEEFCKSICLFLSPKLDLKINYVFQVYDFNGNGNLDWGELYILLKHTIVDSREDEDPDQTVKDLIELVMKVIKYDPIKGFDLEQFKQLVTKDIVYLQLLGPCLPSEVAIHRFRNILDTKTPWQVSVFFAPERIKSLCEHKQRCVKEEYYPIQLDMP